MQSLSCRSLPKISHSVGDLFPGNETILRQSSPTITRLMEALFLGETQYWATESSDIEFDTSILAAEVRYLHDRPVRVNDVVFSITLEAYWMPIILVVGCPILFCTLPLITALEVRVAVLEAIKLCLRIDKVSI